MFVVKYPNFLQTHKKSITLKVNEALLGIAFLYFSNHKMNYDRKFVIRNWVFLWYHCADVIRMNDDRPNDEVPPHQWAGVDHCVVTESKMVQL